MKINKKENFNKGYEEIVEEMKNKIDLFEGVLLVNAWDIVYGYFETMYDLEDYVEIENLREEMYIYRVEDTDRITKDLLKLTKGKTIDEIEESVDLNFIKIEKYQGEENE